jgi:hypothetical protein
VGNRVRVRGNYNIVVLTPSGNQNYSDVEGIITRSQFAPNGKLVYYITTQYGDAMEVNNTEHQITLVPEVQPAMRQQPHLNPPMRQQFAFAPPPPNPPNISFNFNPPPPPPPERRRYHRYQLNDIVRVNGLIHLGLFKYEQNPSYTRVFQKIGTIIEASEYSDGVPIYDIQFDDTCGFRVNEDFIEKLTPQEIRSRQQAAEQRAQDQLQENLEEQILERRQQELERQIRQQQQPQQQSQPQWGQQAPVQQYSDMELKLMGLLPISVQQAPVQQQLQWGQPQQLSQPQWGQSQQPSQPQWGQPQQQPSHLQQERQLAEARRKAGTKKATINRNDGRAKYIQLRIEPKNDSTFVIGSVLFNGTEVDILEGENTEWQYVRFSPDRDTEVRGWVRKIYLQNPEVARQLAESVTKKALVNRKDGGAEFIKLRETPNQTSNFKNIPDIPNGTTVDILEENGEWQNIRYSPKPGTEVRGWVKKIYLQNQ